MMRTHLILLLICLACIGTLAQSKKSISMPQTQTIGSGVVLRTSDKKGANGDSLPPWKEAQITNIFGFKRRPVATEKVTVVPLDVDIEPIDLMITKVKKGTPCGQSDWWEVELEPVKQSDFLEIAALAKRREEFPFDVGVIYPAVEFARQVKRGELRTAMLPKGVELNTVKGAIDLTNDGIPDVLMVEYCCGSPKKAADECDNTCGKTFKKVKGAWTVIDTSSPC